MSTEDVQQYVSYVKQDNIKNSVFTTKEILMSVAELRYAGLEAPDALEKRVNLIIKDMQLEKCEDTMFGDHDHKGLSGGEKKRVCIAAKLLIDSPILLLDEPTSGLDSNTSFIIISFLKKYAFKNNKIVLMTIHQPSSNIFNLFDKLIVLDHGQHVYHGKGGTHLIEYFKDRGFSLKDNYNPADSFMRILEENNRDKHGKFFFVDAYKDYGEKTTNKEISRLFCDNSKIIDPVEIYSSFKTAFKVLLRDQFKSVIRNPQVLKVKFLNVLYFIFITGSVFYKLENTEEGNRGKFGFIIFFTINNFIQQINNIVLTHPKERVLLIEDYEHNLYGVVPYSVSRQVVDTSIALIITVLYCCLIYYLIGFKETADNFFVFLGIYLAFNFLVQSLAITFTCFIKTTDAGLRIISLGMVVVYIFSGLIVTPKNIPEWLRWFRFLNPVFYCNQAISINEFEGRVYEGINFYLEIKENLEIWHCAMYFIFIGLVLRVLNFIGLYLVVKKYL